MVGGELHGLATHIKGSHLPTHLPTLSPPPAAKGALRGAGGPERAEWPCVGQEGLTPPHAFPHTISPPRQHKARYEVEQDLNELNGLVSDSESSKSSIRQLGDMAQELMAAWREGLAALEQQLPTLMGECGQKWDVGGWRSGP